MNNYTAIKCSACISR